MKTMFERLCGLLIVAAALVLISGCVVEPRHRVRRPVVVVPAPVYVAPPPPVAYEPPPPPAPPEVVMVPETYVWDGYEYIGVVGDRYYYLGPGQVWIVAEPFRLQRFHGWERYHPDWRAHAIRNERFRASRVEHGVRKPLPKYEERR